MKTTTAKKLGIKPGTPILLLNAPEGGVKLLGKLPEGVTITKSARTEHPFVLAFVQNKFDVDQIGPTAVKATKPEGALWFAYPKRTGSIKTDITRDVGWSALYDLRYRPVTQIAIDETWTGFRFRPIELVKKR
jgi:hypothetical protein